MANISLGVINNSYASQKNNTNTRLNYPNSTLSTSSSTSSSHRQSIKDNSMSHEQQSSESASPISKEQPRSKTKSNRNNRMHKNKECNNNMNSHLSLSIESSDERYKYIIVAHKGSLLRRITNNTLNNKSLVHADTGLTISSSSTNPIYYSIEIPLHNLELNFDRMQYERITNLFSIIDTDSKGIVSKKQVNDFVALRCPLFRRRDQLLYRFNKNKKESKSTSSTSADYSSSVAATATTTTLSSMLSGAEKHMENIMKRMEGSTSASASTTLTTGSSLNSTTKMSNINESSSTSTSSSTFDEVWNAVISSDESTTEAIHHHNNNQNNNIAQPVVVLGIEGFAIFCRFIALAQYLEARQRFSQRHRQQTQKEDLEKSAELLVMVDVPPPLPPGPLTIKSLKEYERKKQQCYTTPFPELDLNHCLVASHDDYYYSNKILKSENIIFKSGGKVIVSPFGQQNMSGDMSHSSSTSSSLESLHVTSEEEFVLSFYSSLSSDINHPTSIVRRTMTDMEWLYDTIKSHQLLGGTLCGRILPPFPKKCSSEYSYGFVNNIVKNLLWGIAPSSGGGSSKGNNAHHSRSGNKELAIGFYARQLERCLNYLLEHPALFSSFPLNAILKASQIGLQAAKGILEEETAPSSQRLHSINTYPTTATTVTDDSKTSVLPTNATTSSSEQSSSIISTPATSFLSNLSWVRTAAQAAMALKLHGILDATGYASASARLQHASLPNLDTSRSLWRGDENHLQCNTPPPSLESESSSGGKEDEEYDNVPCFENGVVRIQSELDTENDDDDDYDLLPSPCASNSVGESSNLFSSIGKRNNTLHHTNPIASTQENNDSSSSSKRYSYGPLHDSTSTSYAASIDSDIDKLSEIITSVHSTLSRCSVVSQTISDAKRERQKFHSNIVRGLDSWISLRGYELMNERALLNAVSSLDRCTDIRVKSDASLNDNLSWQSSLASCAVSATEDVRSAMQASNTAMSAKAAAESAALSAQKAYESMASSSAADSRPEDLRILRTRASISHSHAIYAAVIQHESFSAKRKAALALAHDVRFWNSYRKREILKTCLEAAKSQKDAASKSVDAWELLKTGLFGQSASSECSSSITSLSNIPSVSNARNETKRNHITSDNPFSAPVPSTTFISCPKIVPVDHVALAPKQQPIPSAPSITSDKSTDSDLYVPKVSTSSTKPIEPTFIHDAVINNDYTDSNTNLIENNPSNGAFTPHRDAQLSQYNNNASSEQKHQQQQTQEGNLMTSSMQSLVDGLMTWGFAEGQYDPQDDMSLPSGMAVSIALEETAAITSFSSLVAE